MRTRTKRSAIIAATATMLLLAGCQPRTGGDTTTETLPAPTPPVETEPVSALPSSYAWVGGEENGLRLGVPAEWVEAPPQYGSLAERHGFSVIDPEGARDHARYEAHLVAFCQPNPGVTTQEELQSAIPEMLIEHENLVTERVTINGIHFVRSEYAVEAPDGTREHWFAYDFLASGDRHCKVTLTTPLQGARRETLEAIFEEIGTTIEPLDPPPDAGGDPTEPVKTEPATDLEPPERPDGSEAAPQLALDACELLTHAEIEDMLGKPVTAEAFGWDLCSYETIDNATTFAVGVSVPDSEIQAEHFPELIEEEFRNLEPRHDFQPIDGPGDSAVLATARRDGTPVSVLHVLAGGVRLSVLVSPADQSDWSADTLTELAGLAVQRLP